MKHFSSVWLSNIFQRNAYSGFFALLVVLTLVLLSFFLIFTYKQTEETINIISANESRILASQMDAVLRRIMASSNLVAENIILEALSEPLSLERVDRINRRLNALSSAFPEIIGLHFFDSMGQLIFNSGTVKEKVSIADRAHFHHMKEFPDRAIHFTDTLTSKIFQHRTVIAYRAVVDSSGEFFGVISIPIDLDFFEQLFARLNVGAHGMVSIRRSDNSRLVVRWPDVEQGINKEAVDIPPYQQIQNGVTEGVVRYIGRTDGVDRIFAFNKVSDFPFFVLVGYAFDEQFARWHKISSITSIITFMALLLLGFFLYSLTRSQTRLHQSENQYQAIVECQQDAVCRWLPDTTITFANNQYAKLFGFTEGKILIGKRWIEFLPENERKTTLDNYIHLAELSKPFSCERSLILQNESIRYFHWIDIPLLNVSGKCIEFQSVGRDITELKRAEEEKQKLQNRLIQAQKMESIGSLAGGIAHDLNNILFPISGLSEMLLDETTPDNPVYASIEQIYKSAQRGSGLVKQILAFSRQSNPRKLPIRIQPILKEVVMLSRSTIPKNIEIKSHISKDCRMVSADPTQVHQIAMNLITNAYHAVEQTGGIIHVELKETVIEAENSQDNSLNSGQYACITLSDTGTGIDQSLIDKIFDPYFTTKDLGKGTGLGLSVVHGIVKDHGGDIRVYSEVGKGTVFHVYLPLLEGAEDSATSTANRQYPTGSERILLVDDEAAIARMVQIMLEKQGYHVTTITNSLDALDAFRVDPFRFDLVISDRGMPKMTGEQLAGELISIRPEIPIIICTGFSDENDEKRAREIGVKGLLKKPVTRADLTEMVRKVLNKGTETYQG